MPVAVEPIPPEAVVSAIDRWVAEEMAERPEAMVAARAEFLERTGRFDDTDPFYETRTKLFVDGYLLDRRGADGRTPVERRSLAATSPEERAICAALRNTHRSLFAVLNPERAGDVPKPPKGRDSNAPGAIEVRLVDLYFGGEWLVTLARPLETVRARELIDARLHAWGGDVRLTPGLLFHPPEVHAVVCRLSDEHRRRGAPIGELLDLLARMRMRLDRYHGIAPEKIYGSPERPTPPHGERTTSGIRAAARNAAGSDR